MELFSFDTEGGELSASQGVELSENAPLAARLRPDNLSEVLGQDHLISEGTPLRRLLDGLPGAPPSIILFGPPGVGKTLLAKSLCKALDIPFVQITLGGQNDGERELMQTLLFLLVKT